MHARSGHLCALILISILSGCATGYHSVTNPILGWTGGYWDKKGPGELIKVGFAGNGYIQPDKVGVYLLYHSAEVAQREGKRYFVLYQNLYSAIADRRSSEKRVTTLTGKPTTYAYILLLDQEEDSALVADEVIARFKSQVKTEPKS
jgi:hypothetical protein